MKPEKLKKLVYSYDKWGAYSTFPLFLVTIIFIFYYSIIYNSNVFSDEQMALFVLFQWLVIIFVFTMLLRGYASIQSKEYLDPYWRSLNKKRRRYYYMYLLACLTILLFFVNHLVFSYFTFSFFISVLIFSVALFFSYTLFFPYIDKVLNRIKIKKSNILNVIYITLSIALLILLFVILFKFEIFVIKTDMIPQEEFPGFELSQIHLGDTDEYILKAELFFEDEKKSEKVIIETDEFCKKKGHHITPPLDFGNFDISYNLYEYQFLGRYGPKIYCIEEIEN